MAILLWLIFMAWVCIVVYWQWRTGKIKITSVRPQVPQDRVRLIWLVVGAANFLAFGAEIAINGTCAFPTGGHLIDGHYLVPSHGREISFSPTAFWFSYIHGVVFVIVHLMCMFAISRLRRKEVTTDEKPVV
jgi:hypothetical protein